MLREIPSQCAIIKYIESSPNQLAAGEIPQPHYSVAASGGGETGPGTPRSAQHGRVHFVALPSIRIVLSKANGSKVGAQNPNLEYAEAKNVKVIKTLKNNIDKQNFHQLFLPSTRRKSLPSRHPRGRLAPRWGPGTVSSPIPLPRGPPRASPRARQS